VVFEDVSDASGAPTRVLRVGDDAVLRTYSDGIGPR